MHLQGESEAALDAFRKAADGAQSGAQACMHRLAGRAHRFAQRAGLQRSGVLCRAAASRPPPLSAAPSRAPSLPPPADELRVRSWVAQATLHRRLGQPQAAVDLLRRAARAAPEVEAAYLQPLLAELQGGAGDLADPAAAAAAATVDPAAAAAAGRSPLELALEREEQQEQQEQQPEEAAAVARRQGES